MSSLATGPAAATASRFDRLRELSGDVGGRWFEASDDDAVTAITAFARQHQITQIVIGSSRRSRWQQLTSGGPNVTRLIREAGAFGIDVHISARPAPPGADSPAADAGKRDDPPAR
jgi:two-component system, OmpR family, sensor histidine kinase KdpD